jgi:hypothetical protein
MCSYTQEVQEKMMNDQTMKLNNRLTWRDQINLKRQQVSFAVIVGLFCCYSRSLLLSYGVLTTV